MEKCGGNVDDGTERQITHVILLEGNDAGKSISSRSGPTKA